MPRLLRHHLTDLTFYQKMYCCVLVWVLVYRHIILFAHRGKTLGAQRAQLNISWWVRLPLQRDFVGLNQTIYDSTWMPFVRLFSAQLQRDFEQLNRTLYYGYIFSVLTISSLIFFFGSSSIYKNANFQEFMWLFKHSKLNQITNVTQPRIV